MVVLFRRFHPGRSVLCSLLAIAICYFAVLCVLEKRGFWITDNANKFLQVQALANSRYTDFSIPWPGQIVDPDFVYNPLPYYFTRVESGKLYSVFSPVFALISALFFDYLGHWGLYLLPALSSLAMLAGLAQLARLISQRIAVGHVAVLTPDSVRRYSSIVWSSGNTPRRFAWGFGVCAICCSFSQTLLPSTCSWAWLPPDYRSISETSSICFA